MTKRRLNKLRETMKLRGEMEEKNKQKKEAVVPKKAERCPQCNASRMNDFHGYPPKMINVGPFQRYYAICMNNWHNTLPK